MYAIGEVSRLLGLSRDTLRYYEKISILPTVSRNESGRRLYDDKDLSRLRFVKRAQRMGFSLIEIRQLLIFREDPGSARPAVRKMAREKLTHVEETLGELTTLRDELLLLINLCQGSKNGCPILEKMG